MSDELRCLREYAAQGSESAFEALVGRHINLVYSAALRRTGDAAMAEEISQVVFIILARKAGSLGPKTVLSGWLYRTALYVAADALRSQRRRQQREQEAYMQSIPDESSTGIAWQELAPLLDEGMARLGQADRDALVLRYFEGRSLAEVGSALGLGEEAAGKRVHRAVEKLRGFFARRGVVASTVILTGAVSANSVHAAPAGLVAVATAGALAKGAGATASTLALMKGALNLMAWYKAKAVLVTAAALALATGTASLAVKAVSSAHATVPAALQGVWETADFKYYNSSPLGAVHNLTLHVILRVAMTNGDCHAAMDITELGVQDYCPVGVAAGKNGTIRLQFGRFGYFASFAGTLDPSGAEIHGVCEGWDGSRQKVLWKRRAEPYTPAPRLTESEYAPSANSTLQGFWEGAASIRGIPWRQNLKIAEPSPGTFRAEIDFTDLGLHHVPLRLAFNKPGVKLWAQWVLGAELEGTLSSDNTQIAGIISSRDGPIPWSFKRVASEAPANALAAPKRDLEGQWQGTRTVRGLKFPYSLRIARRPDGKLSASVEGEGAIGGAAATVVRYRAPNLRVEWVWLGCSFDGTLERGKLSGVWKDALGPSRVVFERKEPK